MAHSCPLLFYIHDAMSSAALRRSASVNSTFFYFRELSSSSSASCRRDPPSLRAAPQSNRWSPTSPMFNRADVHSCNSSTVQLYSSCIRFHVPAVTEFHPLLMQTLRRQLSLSQSRSSYLQLLQTVHTQTLNIQTVHSRLHLQQLLLLGYCIIVGLAYEVHFISSTA